MIPEPFDLFAVRYAVHAGRSSSENFIGGDLHEAGSDLAYFVWIARRSDRLFLIDTGFGPEAAAQRGRTLLDTPARLLTKLDIAADRIEDVILTHLHYDHAGTIEAFPNARFHVQDAEAAFATGRCMCHPFLRQAYDVEDAVAFLRRLYSGRVIFHDGEAEICSGLSVHHVGGHSGGLQVVRVWTRRGWVVLASDASHLYANMREARPFPIVHNVERMLEGYRLIYRLAESPQHVIPGHDPLVMSYYPPLSAELSETVFRLDEEPVER